MPVQFTSRRKNRYPQAGDVPVVHTDIQNLATDLDDAPTYDQGVILSRPTSTAPSPGEVGRWYRSTNQGPGNQGLLYLDTGTSWDNIAKYAHINVANLAARPTASADLEGLKCLVLDSGNEWQVISSTWTHVGHNNKLLTVAQFLALPAQDDGTIVRVLADATNGIIWRLRFRSASAHASKWECEGGPELFSETTATTASISAATYIDLAGSPAIVVPLGGEYNISHGAMIAATAQGNSLFQSVLYTGTVASDTEAIAQGSQSTAGTGNWYSVARQTRRPIAINFNVHIQYKAGAGSGTAQQRWLKLQPVRVTGP